MIDEKQLQKYQWNQKVHCEITNVLTIVFTGTKQLQKVHYDNTFLHVVDPLNNYFMKLSQYHLVIYLYSHLHILSLLLTARMHVNFSIFFFCTLLTCF